MEQTYLSLHSSLSLIIIVGLFFILIGHLNTKKFTNNNDYIVGDRDENTFSLTTSLVASALGCLLYTSDAADE